MNAVLDFVPKPDEARKREQLKLAMKQIAAAGVTPVITNNPLTAAGTVGTPFSFTITATGSPTSYDASPLPAGLVPARRPRARRRVPAAARGSC